MVLLCTRPATTSICFFSLKSILPNRIESTKMAFSNIIASRNHNSTSISSSSSPTAGADRKLPILLFDVMDTIVRDPFYHDIPAFFRMSFDELIESKHPTAWIEFEKGLIDEAELARIFFKDGRTFDLEGLKDCMIKGYSYLEGVEELLNDLKENNYEMHAFTNYPIWYQMIEDKLKISRYLSWTFCSCTMGKRKPELDFFSDVHKYLQVEPENCIFIDDRLRNSEAAVEAGMIGLHFKNVASLRRALSLHGVATSANKHDDANQRPDGIMELQPMNPYNRLLLHRLADIFGFAHESVGEGEDRHLILMQCPETSVPSILVSDILGQYDDYQYQTSSHHLLRRTEDSPETTSKSPAIQYSLEERQAAYLAARQRIFSRDESQIKDSIEEEQKPRNVPVVAQRMIAHALGQRIKPCSQNTTPTGSENSNFQDGDEITRHSSNNANLIGKTNDRNSNRKAVQYEKRASREELPKAELTNSSVSLIGRNGSSDKHAGAAKRMFAHALGLNPTKDNRSRSSVAKAVDKVQE